MKNVIPKPMKRTINLLIASLIIGLLFPMKAQVVDEVIISGVVKDKDSRKKLENVNIAVIGSNVGTVTNADGAFTLKVSQSEIKQGLLASYIGYMNTKISVEELLKVRNEPLSIWMHPSTEWLNEVNVYGGSPRELVEKAISKIAVNYAEKDNMYQAFYRETIQKGRRYIGVAAAVMDAVRGVTDSVAPEATAEEVAEAVPEIQVVTPPALDIPSYIDYIKESTAAQVKSLEKSRDAWRMTSGVLFLVILALIGYFLWEILHPDSNLTTLFEKIYSNI